MNDCKKPHCRCMQQTPCPNHHYSDCGWVFDKPKQPNPTVDGAGVRGRFEEQFKDWKFHHEGLPCFNDALVKAVILRFLDDELSRLHSHILEEVEKEKEVIRSCGEECTTPYMCGERRGKNIGIEKSVEKINQAFKDL